MKILRNGELLPVEDMYTLKRQAAVFNKKTHKSSSIINGMRRDGEIPEKLLKENTALSFYQKRHSIQEYDRNHTYSAPKSYSQTELSKTSSANSPTTINISSNTTPTNNQIDAAITSAKAARVISKRESLLPSYETVEQAAKAIKTAKKMDITQDAANMSTGKKTEHKTTGAATTVAFIKGVSKAESPVKRIGTGFRQGKDPIKNAQESARAKRYLKNSQRRRAKANVRRSAYYKSKTASKAIAIANTKKNLLAAAFGGAAVILLTVIILLVIMIAALFKPQYSTLTMREIMKIYEQSWSNVLTEASLSMTTYDSDNYNGTFGYLYGDTGIDWRACLSVYYAALLTNEEASPETDLNIASNSSILNNESDSEQGNLFGEIFWLFNDVLETNSITVQIPDDSIDPAMYYLSYYNDYNSVSFDHATIIPIIHRDIESVMDILGFTEWQKIQARLYYSDPAYDSYFSGIINSLNYGPGTDMVYTAQQQLNNYGYIYRSWFTGVPQTTGEVHDWCVIFAAWCAYQNGYSTLDGQMGIVPKHNDTTGLYNWYRTHPEAGTVYYCYNGAMLPDEIPLQPGAFLIWENNGNTSHQEHLNMIEAYYPETQTFDTIDGNSYSGSEPPSGYYYVTEHLNRSWSNKIYAVIIPAYPEESLSLEYSPLQNAIDEGRYPTNYEALIEQFDSINIGGRTIIGTYDRTVDQVIGELNYFINEGVDPACLTETPYHSYNLPSASYGESQQWTGMDYLVQGQPSNAHIRFYDEITIPDWYFSGGYYEHVQYCGADPHSN